jgi:hypothetical protein
MTLLNTLFWVILILWALGFAIVANTTYPHAVLYHSGVLLALFVIIGLKCFKTPIV